MTNWKETADRILRAELDRSEVDRLLPLMAEAAGAGPVFTAGDVLPGIVYDLDEFYRHGASKGGERATPGFSMLLSKMAAAADKAK